MNERRKDPNAEVYKAKAGAERVIVANELSISLPTQDQQRGKRPGGAFKMDKRESKKSGHVAYGGLRFEHIKVKMKESSNVAVFTAKRSGRG